MERSSFPEQGLGLPVDDEIQRGARDEQDGQDDQEEFDEHDPHDAAERNQPEGVDEFEEKRQRNGAERNDTGGQTDGHLLPVEQRVVDGHKSVGQGKQHVPEQQEMRQRDDGDVGLANGLVLRQSPVNQFDRGGDEKRQVRENDSQ